MLVLAGVLVAAPHLVVAPSVALPRLVGGAVGAGAPPSSVGLAWCSMPSEGLSLLLCARLLLLLLLLLLARLALGRQLRLHLGLRELLVGRL